MERFDLDTNNSSLLLIDAQERFQGAIAEIAADGACLRQQRILAEGCALLGVPAVITEQYPKGLGPTIGVLRHALPSAEVREKTHFSCLDDHALRERLCESADTRIRTHWIVAGVEAHVCVLATVADLINHGKWVVVASDAVASRNPTSCGQALDAMRQLGALVLPVESILFRLQRQAGVGAFKAISALVR
jgi:nicotinamidase-related amidase